MSKSSESPKGRINIVYRPATGTHPEGVELPLTFVMIGDYTLRQDETPLEDSRVINVDKTNFENVLREQNITLNIDVDNHVSGQGRLPVSLTMDSMAAFSPESIVRHVPQLNRLREFREALNALAGPIENKRAFRQLIDKLLAEPALRERLKNELGAFEQAENQTL